MMRKSFALCGGALFVVLSLSIYLVVDQMSRMPSYESLIEAQVNRKVLEPLIKMEQDVDRLQDNIVNSHKALKKLEHEAWLEPHIAPATPPHMAEGGGKVGGSMSVVHTVPDLGGDDNSFILEATTNDGCQFSKSPSGLSADVKMLDVYDTLPFDNPDGGAWKQGWDVQREKDEEHLDVFVVPHSHNDPGWIKTVDAYYLSQTRHILDNIVDALSIDKRRKFIWAEMSYLSMWWAEADEKRKENFKKLVHDGQIEIVTGGWVMNDEANTHYFAMIDQLLEGHQWLQANIGVKPRAGWAIDPFGHSPTMAYILKRIGFHSMLIQRTHYSVKKYLARRKKLEFLWRQNWDHGSSTDMFCHMMPFYSYDVPHTCGPEPAICCQFDFRRLLGGGIHCPWNVAPKKITEHNIAERAETLLDQYRKKATLYKNNVLLVPLGDDFRYDVKFETTEQFTNYQKLFDYMNSKPELKVKAQFGTLSDYFDTLFKKSGVKPGEKPPNYPTLSGDFYTYADRDDHYWSGYYTSRPFYKNMDRVLESRLRASEIIFYLASSHARKNLNTQFPTTDLYHLLVQARRNLALFQHHDGITGTAKDHVVIDYGTRLLRSLQDTARIVEESSRFLLHKQKTDYKKSESSLSMIQHDEERQEQDSFPEKKVLQVEINQPRKVTLYNPLSEQRKQIVSVFVSTPNIKVTDSSGHDVVFQVSPVFDESLKPVLTKFRVHFYAEIPPFGLSTYNIIATSSLKSASKVALYHFYGDVLLHKAFNVERKDWSDGSIVLENDQLQLSFDATHGMMTKLTNIQDGKTMDIYLSFMTYGTAHARDKSGAYLFLPDGPAKPMAMEKHSKMVVIKGSLFDEITVKLRLVTHVVRVNKLKGVEGQMIEIENAVDIKSEHNKELAMRFSTTIQNDDKFFTDLNGFQLQLRKTLTKLPLQANFYPMPNSAIIQDAKIRFTLHSAQAHGVGSLKTGSLEVILDRRLSQDDNRGLQQGVLDNKLTPAIFRLFVERFHSKPDQESEGVPVTYHSLASTRVSQRLSHPTAILHHALPSATSPTALLDDRFSGLSRPLSCDLFVLNLRTIQDGVKPEPTSEAALLLQRHGYDCSLPSVCKTEQGKLKLKNLFSNLSIGKIQRSSLTLLYDEDLKDDQILSLNPMEVQTYKLKLE